MLHKLIDTVSGYTTFTITLSDALIQRLTQEGYCRVQHGKRRIELFLKQEQLDTDTRSFQLVCQIDGSFIGYCLIQARGTEILLTQNPLLHRPDLYDWTDVLQAPAHRLMAHYNREASVVLRVESQFQFEQNTRPCRSGRLILTASLLAAATLYLQSKTLYVEPSHRSIYFYQDMFRLTKEQTDRLRKKYELSLDLTHCLFVLQRTIDVNLPL